jgi:WD40 repeat protein
VPIAALEVPPETRRGWFSRRHKPRPQPDAPRKRPLTQGLRAKVAMALVCGGSIVAFHDQIPKALEPSTAAITTGTLAPPVQEQSTLTASADFKAHDAAIRAVRLSGDGRLLVTLGGDNAIKVWAADGFGLQGLISLDPVSVTSMTVRNNRVAVAYADGTFSLYDLETRTRLHRFKRGELPVTSIAFAGSEERLASGSGDATIALWETASVGEPVSVLNGPASSVEAVAIDHDGRWLAAGSDDRSVKIWNLQTRDGERTLRNHSGSVSAVGFAPDGSTLAAGSADGGVRIWSMQSGRLLRVLNAHDTRIQQLAFSPDSEWLATAAQDGSLRVRSIKRSRQAWSLGRFERPVTAATFAHDGLSVLAGGEDGTIRQYMLPIGRVAQRN